MIEAPIFHVNGDDPLAVVFVTQLAVEYRQAFQADVVIDMYCYRRHGHNESDEPSFTNPELYDRIAKHPPVSEQLSQVLIERRDFEQKDIDAIKKEYETSLEESLERVKNPVVEPNNSKDRFAGSTATFQAVYSFDPVDTRVQKADLARIVEGPDTRSGWNAFQ